MGKSVEHWDKPSADGCGCATCMCMLTVVRSGSMAKAARNLSVSQPAISKAMTDLEHILGVRLLDRGPQGRSGDGCMAMRWFAAASPCLGSCSKRWQISRSLRIPHSGDVNVGCNESLAASLMPAVVEQLASHHPGIAVHTCGP
jgi:DNA-binding transcriptional LysR family regulator